MEEEEGVENGQEHSYTTIEKCHVMEQVWEAGVMGPRVHRHRNGRDKGRRSFGVPLWGALLPSVWRGRQNDGMGKTVVGSNKSSAPYSAGKLIRCFTPSEWNLLQRVTEKRLFGIAHVKVLSCSQHLKITQGARV